jgi:hypothetical protein
MSRRYQAGFIFPGYDPLEVPDAPTIGTATGGDEELSVAFTAPADTGGGAITAYNAIAITGGANVATGTNTASPVTVTGLTNGTAYTAKVWAINAYGPSPLSAASGSVTPNLLQRALFAGGSGGGNVIDYVDITTSGNATDFGDLLLSDRFQVGFGSATRGIFAVGDGVNLIQYVTIASTGNAIDFGDATTIFDNGSGGCSNSIRGLFGGGFNAGTFLNVVNFVTIASVGNATDFGDLFVARYGVSALASSSRAVFVGGESVSGFQDILDYATISSAGNFSDFGNLINVRRNSCSLSSDTRGVVGGSYTSPGSAPYFQNLDYITIASTGNSLDFGDATVGFADGMATSGLTTGLFTISWTGTLVNTIDQIVISSTGNATDFGDLTVARSAGGATSSAHGGLQ